MVYGALDIGGTKIAGALVDGEGRVLARSRRATPAQGSAAELMARVTAVLDDLSARPEWTALSCLGIGSAGPVDTAAGTVSPVNIPAWRSFPLVDRVREHPRLPAAIRPVLVGDAVAMTAAERWTGAARAVDNALCMVVSTGVGGGLVLNGALHTGRSGNAGHIGHITVDQHGPLCPCGARGCVERFASGTAIAAHALESGWTPPPGVPPTAAAVADAARTGDPRARAAFERAGRALAAGIAATAALVELDLVVIGGGVAQAGEVLFGPIRRHLADYASLDFTRDVPVVPAHHALDAGLIGAAAAAAGATTAGPTRAEGLTRPDGLTRAEGLTRPGGLTGSGGFTGPGGTAVGEAATRS
ncbi:ROK family protein [Streptomyces sp. SudanB25_2051]|uniref:ROK family protein n=1 Tax=Streptomyces sp. SudanB25_2051 TaxID=3035275 RepID=UPI003F563AE1